MTDFRYDGERAHVKILVTALAFLVSIEPDPQQSAARCARFNLDEGEHYSQIRRSYAGGVAAAETAIQTFAMQLRPATATAMQRVYYRILARPEFQVATAASVAATALNRAWRGINGWQ